MKILYNSKRKYENWTANVGCSCGTIYQVNMSDLEIHTNLWNEQVYVAACPVCKQIRAVTDVPDIVRNELRRRDENAQLSMFGMAK